MAKKERGRQSTGDMVRSLGLVLAIVLVVFYLAQPPHSDAKKLRAVDPSSDVQAFAAAAPGAAVPRAVPPGWRSNVSTYDPDTKQLRVGYVTPKGEYVEYAGAVETPAAFVSDITGQAPAAGTVDVDGVTWQEYRQDKAISLVRSYGTTTIVLGTLRDTAPLDELRLLASRLTA